MPEGPDRWKAEYDADPALAAEFGGDFEAYAGWRLNENRLAKHKRRAN